MQIKLSLNEVSQTFDLQELFGVDVSDYPEVALSFAQSVIDTILDRTADNVGIDGKPLKSYDEDYTDTLGFKAAGKSENDVNMEQSGSMLADLDILSLDGNILKIGFKDDLQIKKAYNHNVGDTLPKRPFFGVNRSEVEDIIASLSDDIEEIKRQNELKDSMGVAELTSLFGAEFDDLPSFGSPARRIAILDLLDEDYQ